MPELNGQINSIQKALQSTKINEATDEQLTTRLSIIFMMIGLRPQHFPTHPETHFLLQHLREEYGHKTLDELQLAFRLGATGKLDLDDINPYDQFTIIYLTKIMAAYRKHLITISKTIETKPTEIMIDKITDEEKKQEIEEWRCKKDININLIPMYIYEWLCEFGHIILENSDKKRLYERAADYRLHQLREEAETGGGWTEYNRYVNMHSKGFRAITGEEVNNIRSISKKIAVFEWIKNNK